MNKTERISIDEFKALQKGQKAERRQNKEYLLYKEIANYLKLFYPKVIYHFDLTGLNLSKTQAGMLKAIQHSKGFPDLAIYQPKKVIVDNEIKIYSGLFIELKTEGTKIYKFNKTGLDYFSPATPHLQKQQEMLYDLKRRGYKAKFAVGFDECKKIIDEYMNL